jgi:phosphotriesterase-related protein
VSPDRYDAGEVFRVALPKLKELSSRGCRTLVECTPAYLGRDPRLFRRLSEASGLHIVTNTGYYGANKDRHVPAHAYNEPVDRLAGRWIREYEDGIDGTGVKPGFMKIGVDAGPLSEIDAKLVSAACLCHSATGLRMHIHTGDGTAAMNILELLAKRNVPPSAYVWVHAQSEKDRKVHLQAAKAGAWLEFDGIGRKTLQEHADAVAEVAGSGYLDRILVSQDSGWYRVGEPQGGQYNGYTHIFDAFVPEMRRRGFTPAQIDRLLVDNPARALTWQ